MNINKIVESLKGKNNLELNKSHRGFYKVSRFGVNLFIFNSSEEMDDKTFYKLAKKLNLKKYNTNFYH